MLVSQVKDISLRSVVQKSLTPDVDADTLGGIINMKTISAFDRDGQFVRAKLEGAYNEITEEVSPKATLTYSNTFGDRLGVAVLHWRH